MPRGSLGLVLMAVIGAAGCGSKSANDGGGPGMDPGDLGSGSTDGGLPFNGVQFPWPVFDGTIPDVPPSTSGKTYYCDPVNGNDAWDGSSATMTGGTTGPRKTITATIKAGLKEGDTVLLAGGVYREQPNFYGLGGKAGAPITFGSYGHGTGAPILDGGIKPNMWTRYNGHNQTTVWKTSTSGLAKITSSTPVEGIYVRNGDNESALKEVAHGQIAKYGSDPLPPSTNQDGINDMSNEWYFDASGNTLYADFGGTLGAGDPNNADISILYDSGNGPNGHEILVVLSQDYVSFIGLTIRASSWSGVFAQAGHLTFDHCDVKFNGGGGIFFDGTTTANTDGNTVTSTRIWRNVLVNWPRFNNGFTGGGWPGAISWSSQSDVTAEGNVIYGNGGEGLILWFTAQNGGTTHTSTNNLVRHNVIFDNFSVNVYLDNTQGAIIDSNFVFDHPRDPSETFDNLLTLSPGYNGDFGKRMTPIDISLADEPGSAFDMAAHLANITVVNNIFAGGNFGFVDYDDGTQGTHHGLKNCVIANNSWVLGSTPIPNLSEFGWRHGSLGGNADASMNSVVENNIIVLPTMNDQFVQMGQAGANAGVTTDYNIYGGPAQWQIADNTQDFTAWKAANAGWDVHSQTADPMVTDVSEFNRDKTDRPVYDWSKAALSAGSPAIGAGTTVQAVTTDFTGAQRSGANDIGAVAHH